MQEVACSDFSFFQHGLGWFMAKPVAQMDSPVLAQDFCFLDPRPRSGMLSVAPFMGCMDISGRECCLVHLNPKQDSLNPKPTPEPVRATIRTLPI